MTALEKASTLTGELDSRHIGYQLMIVRPEAIMVSVAVPGERWEIEFFDDDHVELERFVTQGVDNKDYAPPEITSMLLGYLEDDEAGTEEGPQ